MVENLNPINFPLNGVRLIEASAGTGKTYTIAALYLRLVLGHGEENGFFRSLTPPEILVVTFTNAATEELRERIRSRLTEAAGFFRGMGQGDAFLEELKADYDPDEWQALALRLDHAAQWMDESAIHTIHGWCQRMLRQHAFDSLSLFDLELAPSDQDLLEEATCDFWRSAFYPESVEALNEFKYVAGISTPQELFKQVRPVIDAVEYTDLSMPPDPFTMVANRLQAIKKAKEVWANDFDLAVTQVQKALADKTLNGNKYRKNSLPVWISQLEQWIKDGGPLPDAQVLEKFSAQGLSAGVSKNKVPPSHSAYDAFDQLIEDLASGDIKQALIYHAAVNIRKRVDGAKERLSRLGFNDLLTRMGKALSRTGSGGDRLAQVIREQFPVAMIDEFQDTDPVQYDSFASIYLNQDQTGLFMIGDPKQAIYAFRGADIYTYLKARSDTQGRRYTLEKNYRSTKAMVTAVNQVFGWASGLPQGPFMFKDQIPFESVKAHGRTERLVVDGHNVPAMTFCLLNQEKPVQKTGDQGYRGRMARVGAQQIARLISLGAQSPCKAGFTEPGKQTVPLKPSDIAVLVKNGDEASAIRSALSDREVKSVYLSDKESVFESPEAQSLLYILQACSDPTNDALIRAALATEVLNLPFADLDRLKQDEMAWEAELDRFKQFQNIWRSQGVLPMIRTVLSAFNVGARMLANPFGERQLTNVLHLAEMIQTAAAELDGEQGVIRWLAGQIENPQGGGNDQILRLESDQDLVRVVTIHKSKGLEYPLVFLPFICSYREVTARNSSVVKIHNPDGSLRFVVTPGDSDLQLADQERLAEDLRILYVALTRARHACWLGMGATGSITKKHGEKTDVHLSGIGYLLKGGDMIPTADLPTILKDMKGDCEALAVTLAPDSLEIVTPDPEKQALSPARTFSGEIHKNWRITSYSGILAGASMPNKVGAAKMQSDTSILESPDTPVHDQIQETAGEESLIINVIPDAQSIHTFARGPEPGTFLHDVLEWAGHIGFDRVVKESAATRAKVNDLCIRRGWDGWSKVLADWLLEMVQTPFSLPGTSMAMSDLGAHACYPEMEFLFAANQVDIHQLDHLVTQNVLPGVVRPVLRQETVNGMLKGFIDLVYQYDNRFFVLDYKSNYLGQDQRAYGQEAMAQAMIGHRYDLQYVIYLLALHRLLKARLRNYDYERDVGGAVYLFLRGVYASGQGVYVDKPPVSLINELDDLFKTKKGAPHVVSY